MTLTMTPESVYARLHETLRSTRAKREPAWLEARRRREFERFSELGFPTTKDEQWRFTNVLPYTEREYRLPPRHGADASVIKHGGITGMSGPRLVFVDGRFVASLSDVAGLPRGVVVESLAQSIARGEPLLEAHLGRLADAEEIAFTAMNTAFFEDGAFVHAPRGVAVDAPIHLLCVSTSGGDPWMIHPRVLVVAEESSRVTVIEHRVSSGEAAHFTNGVTEIAVGEGAWVRHLRIERESDETFGIRALHVEQARDSDFASHSALFGSALLRNGVYPVLAGPGCTSLLNGLFVGAGHQLHDNHMRVRHAAPHCDSRQFYRGILDDDARGVFSGRIIVNEGAQKTDAKQTSMNLLLSDRALVEAKPQLEIYANDVKCTHGATVGQIDADALFYLRARGIDETTARALLIFAFANEVLDRIEVEPVRELLRGLLEERLPSAKAGALA